MISKILEFAKDNGLLVLLIILYGPALFIKLKKRFWGKEDEAMKKARKELGIVDPLM